MWDLNTELLREKFFCHGVWIEDGDALDGFSKEVPVVVVSGLRQS
jgi:hypothetical protein